MLDEQERRILTDFAKETVKEKRRARRWTLFYRLIIIGLILIGLQMISTPAGIDAVQLSGKHTGLVRLEGPMLASTRASADSINSALRRAFENKQSQGVILEINTPGGSPVQAARINNEIQRLRAKYPDKPLYAVVSDVCASGGMYAAVAADKIYADEGSVVGSIGVILGGFGLEEAIQKLGIERRLLTAGEHKALLDPFLPEDAVEVEHIQTLLDQIHAQFIARVKTGRGDRLADDSDLFSGLIWTGEQAKDLGLIDDFGDVDHVAREVIKVEDVVEYAPKRSFLDALAQDLARSALLWLNHMPALPTL